MSIYSYLLGLIQTANKKKRQTIVLSFFPHVNMESVRPHMDMRSAKEMINQNRNRYNK